VRRVTKPTVATFPKSRPEGLCVFPQLGSKLDLELLTPSDTRCQSVLRIRTGVNFGSVVRLSPR